MRTQVGLDFSNARPICNHMVEDDGLVPLTSTILHLIKNSLICVLNGHVYCAKETEWEIIDLTESFTSGEGKTDNGIAVHVQHVVARDT